MATLQDRRDVEFLLYEMLDVDSLARFERFAEHGRETYDLLLDMAYKFSHEDVRPTNEIGDRQGTGFDDGKVTSPEAFRAVIATMKEAGWITLCDDAAIGGQQVPQVFGSMTASLMSSANQALAMYSGLTHGAAKLIEHHGTERQQRLYMDKMLALDWGGTMCLTEASAGSDVGASKATATPVGDGTYRIRGQKIFISWGDHDLSENIVHAVLARIDGDGPGTGGLSIFVVPKFRVNEDGSVGEYNDVACSGVEHKLGIHASPTATLVFGENDGCIGELLGSERQGMRIMFQMMNEARIGVGQQGLGQAEAAYRYALEYAVDRQQGASIRNFKDPEAPRVPIVKHPDVRRMLIDMKSKVEGMRALLAYASLNEDLAGVAEGDERKKAQGLVDLLTPIVKAWCSDTGFDVTETSLQVLGGHGYLADHPVEQYMRDAKICSIYEGTNGIQAMDLLGRKLNAGGGVHLMGLLMSIDELASQLDGHARLGDEAELLTATRNKLAECAMGLGQVFMKGDLEGPLLSARPFLEAMAQMVVSWLLLWQARIADEKLAAMVAERDLDWEERAQFLHKDPEAAFYDGKVQCAQYFSHTYLPQAQAALETINANDHSPLEIRFEGEPWP